LACATLAPPSEACRLRSFSCQASFEERQLHRNQAPGFRGDRFLLIASWQITHAGGRDQGLTKWMVEDFGSPGLLHLTKCANTSLLYQGAKLRTSSDRLSKKIDFQAFLAGDRIGTGGGLRLPLTSDLCEDPITGGGPPNGWLCADGKGAG